MTVCPGTVRPVHPMLHPIPSHPVTPHPILFYVLICLISWLEYTTCNNPIVLRSSSSLSQPVHSFRAENCTDAPANSIFSCPITPLLSVLCILIEKILLCERIFFFNQKDLGQEEKNKTKQTKTKRLQFFQFRTLNGRFQMTSWQWRVNRVEGPWSRRWWVDA